VTLRFEARREERLCRWRKPRRISLRELTGFLFEAVNKLAGGETQPVFEALLDVRPLVSLDNGTLSGMKLLELSDILESCCIRIADHSCEAGRKVLESHRERAW